MSKEKMNESTISEQHSQVQHTGVVAFIGATNVGKSTLLNTLLDSKLAITSPKPQTSRHQIMGILSGPEYQVFLIDTPGVIQTPRDPLDQRMRWKAWDALDGADLAVFVVEPSRPRAIEQEIIRRISSSSKPTILAINKVDKVKKNHLLPVMELYNSRYQFLDVVPISGRYQDGTRLLLDLMISHLPVGDLLYKPDQFTDRSERFLVGELIQEQLFLLYGQEIPYGTAVEIDIFREPTPTNNKTFIAGSIIVSKSSQKGILVGQKGEALKAVGIAARQGIEQLLGREVYLELWVQVRDAWRNNSALLDQLGY